MTFSIVGQVGEAFGVAVASKFLAVGAVVPAARIGVGAAATQATARVSYRREALDALASGKEAGLVLEVVTAGDPDREHRQLGLVGADSQASYTGASCLSWAGGVSGRDGGGGYAIQGNILTGPEVVDAMERSWLASAGQPLAERLMGALLAGDEAGGDSRGRQGAALYAVAPGAGYDSCGVLADLRVDDHPQAPRELARLLEESDLVFGSPEEVQPLVGPLAEEVASRLAGLGYREAVVSEALAAWASTANYEMRLSPDGIDAKVLGALRRVGPA
ncbi:MAG: DUF1028 domain-containing protein [Actinomycetota bacterium]|nr:DUF1028 domain-containing protein [Actinomycetota bacterium]